MESLVILTTTTTTTILLLLILLLLHSIPRAFNRYPLRDGHAHRLGHLDSQSAVVVLGLPHHYVLHSIYCKLQSRKCCSSDSNLEP